MNEAIIIAAASRAITDNNFFMADPNNPHFVDRGLEQMNACKWVISHIFSLPLAQRLTDAEEEMVRIEYKEIQSDASFHEIKRKSTKDQTAIKFHSQCKDFYVSQVKLLERIFGKEFFKEEKI